jgi:hypothetical protein
MLRTTMTVMIAAGAIAAGLTGLAMAAPDTGGWRTQELPQPGGRVTEVAAAGGVQWAVVVDNLSRQSTVWRNSGSGWSRTTLPVQPVPFSPGPYLHAGSADDVWAFVPHTPPTSAVPTGFDVVHWNGIAWSAAGSLGNPGGASSIDDAVVLGPADVWAFSDPGVRDTGTAWHWNGTAWSRVTARGTGLGCGSALSASSIWACDGSSVAHWNGSSWTVTSVARLLVPALDRFTAVNAIVAESADNVYAVGDGNDNGRNSLGPVVLLHWDGKTWTRVASYGFGIIAPDAVCGDGRGGLWWTTSFGNPPLLHWTGGRLIQVSLPIEADGPSLDTMARTSAEGSMLVGGYSGRLGPVLLEYTP